MSPTLSHTLPTYTLLTLYSSPPTPFLSPHPYLSHTPPYPHPPYLTPSISHTPPYPLPPCTTYPHPLPRGSVSAEEDTNGVVVCEISPLLSYFGEVRMCVCGGGSLA